MFMRRILMLIACAVLMIGGLMPLTSIVEAQNTPAEPNQTLMVLTDQEMKDHLLNRGFSDQEIEQMFAERDKIMNSSPTTMLGGVSYDPILASCGSGAEASYWVDSTSINVAGRFRNSSGGIISEISDFCQSSGGCSFVHITSVPGEYQEHEAQTAAGNVYHYYARCR